MIEARKFGYPDQAQPLAEWLGGTVSWQHAIPRIGSADGKVWASIGDWLIRFPDGSVRVGSAGSQDGYCTDCGVPVWWQGSNLVSRHDDRWCHGQDGSRSGRTHWHALAGMAQYVVRSADGQVCHCLSQDGPHIHRTEPVTEPVPGVTAGQVLAGAAGTLQEWTGGWTGPVDGEPRRRVRVTAAGGDHVDILVEAAFCSAEQDRRFRVTLAVRELP